MSNNLFLLAGIALSIAANYAVLKIIIKGEKGLAFLERVRSAELKELEWAIVSSATGGAFFLILRVGGGGIIGVAAVFCVIGLLLYSKALLKLSFSAGVILILSSSMVMFLLWSAIMIFPLYLQALKNS